MDPNEPSSFSRTASRLSHVGSHRAAGDCADSDSDFSAAHNRNSFERLIELVARVNAPAPARPVRELPREGSTIAGRYQIDRLIGCGGMGAVFEAHHCGSGNRYALKWILPKLEHEPDVQRRFKREAEAGLRIRHPNVVRVFAVGEDRGSPFLVMELLRGRSLQRLLADGPLGFEQALAIILPILRGVGAIHGCDVVHRDLKPDNIMLVRDESGLETPKVLDFGLCKPSCEPDIARITRHDVVLGTPAFTAPEQLLGDAVDARADVYSLGVLLYTMLAGRRPFEATHYNRLLFQIATEIPRPLSRFRRDLPGGLDAIVQRAMARERDARFTSVQSLAKALTQLPPGARAQVARAAS